MALKDKDLKTSLRTRRLNLLRRSSLFDLIGLSTSIVCFSVEILRSRRSTVPSSLFSNATSRDGACYMSRLAIYDLQTPLTNLELKKETTPMPYLGEYLGEVIVRRRLSTRGGGTNSLAHSPCQISTSFLYLFCPLGTVSLSQERLPSNLRSFQFLIATRRPKALFFTSIEGSGLPPQSQILRSSPGTSVISVAETALHLVDLVKSNWP